MLLILIPLYSVSNFFSSREILVALSISLLHKIRPIIISVQKILLRRCTISFFIILMWVEITDGSLSGVVFSEGRNQCIFVYVVYFVYSIHFSTHTERIGCICVHVYKIHRNTYIKIYICLPVCIYILQTIL